MNSTTQDEIKRWAKELGWRWNESCNWFAIDLHADGGGPLTTVLNKDAMEVFYKSSQLAVVSARIEENRLGKGNYIVPLKMYQDPIVMHNERIAELEEQKAELEGGNV